MAKRRKMMAKDMDGKSCDEDYCGCKGCSMGLSAMAFIMFLVTVWPAVGNWLLGVPWWVYLIIMVVFGGVGCMKHCYCCKK